MSDENIDIAGGVMFANHRLDGEAGNRQLQRGGKHISKVLWLLRYDKSQERLDAERIGRIKVQRQLTSVFDFRKVRLNSLDRNQANCVQASDASQDHFSLRLRIKKVRRSI